MYIMQGFVYMKRGKKKTFVMPVECIRKQEETGVVIVKMKGMQKSKFLKVGGEKHLIFAGPEFLSIPGV